MAREAVMKSEDKLLILRIGLTVGALLIGWHYIASPKIDEVKKLRLQQEAEIKKEEILKNIAGMEAKEKTYKSGLSEGQEVSWLIESLNQMAQASSVTLTSMVPASKADLGDYRKLPVGIEASGSYHQIGNFVSRIESDPRFIDVENLRMQSQDRGGQKGGAIRLSMTLAALSKKGES